MRAVSARFSRSAAVNRLGGLRGLFKLDQAPDHRLRRSPRLKATGAPFGLRTVVMTDARRRPASVGNRSANHRARSGARLMLFAPMPVFGVCFMVADYLALHPQVAVQTIDGLAVIGAGDSGEVLVLNPVGTRILN